MNFLRLRTIIIEKKLDYIILSSIASRRYYTNFSGSNGLVLVSKDEIILFTDFRYDDQSKQEAYAEVKIKIGDRKNLIKSIGEYLDFNANLTIGIESNDITLSLLEDFNKNYSATYVGINCDYLRIVKSKFEIDQIKRAVEITDIVFSKLLKFIKVGVSEKGILNKIITLSLEYNEVESQAFNPIVVSGINGSKCHGIPSNKLIKNNEFVTIDFGLVVNGFPSDMTRTIFVGNDVSQELENIYNSVYIAQKLAVSSIKVGMKYSEIDAVARDYLTSVGLGEYFGHSLGHGLGFYGNEGLVVGADSQDTVENGHCFTIEPGVYITGLGGVRIEDDIAIIDNNVVVLNKTPKELLKLGDLNG